MQIEEWALAIRAFDQTLARSDSNERQMVACLNNKGLVLEHLGRKEEAAALYEAAIQLGTEAEEPLLNLARLRKSD